MGRAKLALEIKDLQDTPRLMARAIRNAAAARGETRYFTGLPCKAGHVAARQVVNATCVECLEVRRKANMHWFRAHDKKRDAGRREYKSACERKNRQQPHRRAARAAERRARQAAVLQRTPAWADHEKIKAFYRLAAAFSDLHIPHHVDHILPLNGELVSGLHVEHNLQVIPAIDNLRKGAQLLAA